eukprot:2855511-Pleurochrysis_carterae.AAC.1
MDKRPWRVRVVHVRACCACVRVVRRLRVLARDPGARTERRRSTWTTHRNRRLSTLAREGTCGTARMPCVKKRSGESARVQVGPGKGRKG